MLKLVSPTGPTQIPQEINKPEACSSFTADIRLKGPNLYAMAIQDPSHSLDAELILEVEEDANQSEAIAVICHFPPLQDKQLKDLIWEDETLYGIIMIQFQIKILEQLLLFCAAHSANYLIIYTDDAQAEELEVYRNFLVGEDKTLTENGEQTEMIIPATQQTFDELMDFMSQVTIKFRQTLWHDQRENPAIRQYLKSHPLG